jgi:hypothetical protein
VLGPLRSIGVELRRWVVIRTRRVGIGAFVVALVVSALAAGTATATAPADRLEVRARLAPVSGTKATGVFSGTLVKRGGTRVTPGGRTAASPGVRWALSWGLSAPELNGPVAVSLRFGSGGSSAQATRVLCTSCSTKAMGMSMLSARQVTRINRGDAKVVVRTRSAKLRGSLASRR